jgi:hypothetical protein
VYVGIEDALESAITADLVPNSSSRGTAYGVLGAVNGAGDLAASLLVGSLWLIAPPLGFTVAAALIRLGANCCGFCDEMRLHAFLIFFSFFTVLPEPTYDDYARRGESENRNKELKCDLAIDRTSDHRFLANFFRLYLHALALNLLVRLRRAVACPPPPPIDTPVEALTDAARRRYFRLRRQHDPLGEGQPCTWRTLLIKVAAEVRVSSRRILVRLSRSWPYLDWYQRVCHFLESLRPVPTG